MTALEFKEKLKLHSFTQMEFSHLTGVPLATIRTWCVKTEKSSRKVPSWVVTFFNMLELLESIDPVAADYFVQKTIQNSP
jgi:hypothetical protein